MQDFRERPRDGGGGESVMVNRMREHLSFRVSILQIRGQLDCAAYMLALLAFANVVDGDRRMGRK